MDTTLVIQYVLIALAAIVAVGVSVDALRHKLLLQTASRNAIRHPQQTAVVILGLMIGTAIISAALVAGESANFGVEKAVYDALGPIDETVRLDSLNFFDDQFLDDARNDPEAQAFFDGIAPNIIWASSAENAEGDLFEPTVYWIGYDPEPDAAFGDFPLIDGQRTTGSSLQDNEVLISPDLADKLDIGVGDNLRIVYSLPADPLVPNITIIEDTLPASAGGALLGILDLPVDNPTAQTYPLDVTENTNHITAILAWDPRIGGVAPASQLSVALISPSGDRYEDPTLSLTPQIPTFLNITKDDVGGTFEDGIWLLEVDGNVAVNQDFFALGLVFEPIYDLEILRERARELQSQASDLGFSMNLEDFFLGPPNTVERRVAGITDEGKGRQFDFDLVIFHKLEPMQELLQREGQVNLVKFSNPGGTINGGATTDEAMAILNRVLNETKADRPDDAATQNLEPRPLKERFIQLAEDVGASTTGLILFAGSLSVITGLFLIINIFTMLAEERRRELGMARAVGLTQRDLIRTFSYEGSLYAVASALIGSLLGIGLAFVMLEVLNSILARVGDVPPLPFKPSWLSFLTALAAGSLLTFITIYVTSRRTSRMNIVRAIRSIPEPDKRGTPYDMPAGIGLAIIGALWTTYGWLPIERVYDLTPKVFGPVVIALGLGLILRKWIKRGVLYPSVAGGLAIFGLIPTYFLIEEYTNLSEANIVGPIRGVLLTLCAVVVFVSWEKGPRLAANLVRGIKPLRPVATPAFSYPQHKRFRTGMTLAMVSIVVMSVGVLSIFGALLQVPVERQTGGWDVEAAATLRIDDIDDVLDPLPEDLVEMRVEFREYYTPDLDLITVNGERTGQYQNPVHHSLYGYDQSFIDSEQTFRLLFRSDDYDTDEEAYADVLARDDIVIVSYQYSTNERNEDLSFEIGDELEINIGATPITYTIVGIQEQYHFNGIFLPAQTVEDTFPGQINGFYLFEIGNNDPAEAAKTIERAGRDAGLNAEASQVLVKKEQEAVQQLLAAMKLFLSIGLVVGMISLGIITSRSVIERRQEIGMLRSIGYTRNLIVRIFVTEVYTTILVGALIGLATALVVSFGVWYTVIRPLQFPFIVPVGELSLLLLATFVVSFLFTVGPVRRAGKVSAAEALRYSE